MSNNQMSRLHRKLFFPIVGVLWVIIGITICYFVKHEQNRQRQNLENRLLNVNNTVIDAYERGEDLRNTVDFIQLFTDKTTLDPLRITVYNKNGEMVADNPGETIKLYDTDGKPNPGILKLIDDNEDTRVRDLLAGDDINMICSKKSADGEIYTLAALPYQGEVVSFLSIDPAIWIVVILLGIFTSVLAFVGVAAVCRNVYVLRDFANNIANDTLPEDVSDITFSNDELGDVSKQLMRLYSEKITAEQEKINHERQISMNISHELMTPISIIKGYVDSIVENPDMPGEMRENFMQRIQQTIDRLTHLVKDIGLVMKLTEGGIKLEKSEVDMHDLVTRMAGDIELGHIADSLKFSYDIPEGCKVKGHESLLTNALLNLVYNAAKYSGGTMISFNLIGEKDGMYTFTFADNGEGVSPEHLSRLFDLFYRVDSGRARKNGGSGLGLPLVRRIIKAMDGDVTVDNAPTGGLRFTFTLPKA
ncbi:MAG: HAMP domain-containing histidine kinase [Bacteroidales bacterium]|nr:HAMP domain-containing histidine kinase [Bacteroidales bacterium]